MTCSIEGCGGGIVAKGFCDMHYRRSLRGKDLHGGDLIHGRGLRFLENAISSETDECILWPFSSIGRPGLRYGTVRKDGKSWVVSRLVCVQVHGPAPSPDHEAAHICGISLCINKRHIRWATPVENAADKVSHGTQPYGEETTNARFTRDQIREMRSLRGKMRPGLIAKRFDTTYSTVRSILKGESWSWLD